MKCNATKPDTKTGPPKYYYRSFLRRQIFSALNESKYFQARGRFRVLGMAAARSLPDRMNSHDTSEPTQERKTLSVQSAIKDLCVQTI